MHRVFIFSFAILVIFFSGCFQGDDLAKKHKKPILAKRQIEKEVLPKKISVIEKKPDRKNVFEKVIKIPVAIVEIAEIKTNVAEVKKKSIKKITRKEIAIKEKEDPVTFWDKAKGIKTKPNIISTPRGDIDKGASMADVMSVFGNPRNISFYKGMEVWKYPSQDIDEISVYFVNRSVAKITKKSKD